MPHRRLAVYAVDYAASGLPIAALDPRSLEPIEPVLPEQAWLDGWGTDEPVAEALDTWTRYAPGSATGAAVGMLTAEHGLGPTLGLEWVLIRIKPDADRDAREKALRTAQSRAERLMAVRDRNSGCEYLWALSAAVKPRRIAAGVHLFARDGSYAPLPPTEGFEWIAPADVLAGGACKEPACGGSGEAAKQET